MWWQTWEGGDYGKPIMAGDDAVTKKAFEELKKKGMKKLIFDLRGNGGGLLNEAVHIVNFFVPKGTEIVKQKGKVSSMNFNSWLMALMMMPDNAGD